MDDYHPPPACQACRREVGLGVIYGYLTRFPPRRGVIYGYLRFFLLEEELSTVIYRRLWRGMTHGKCLGEPEVSV